MSEPENRTPESSQLAELKSQCDVLNRQVVKLLLALFVVSGTMTVFLGMQARWTGKALEVDRPQAREVMDRWSKEEPVVTTFMSKLADYGRTHPDFAPIISKYRLTNPAAYKTNAAALNTNAALAIPAPTK